MNLALASVSRSSACPTLRWKLIWENVQHAWVARFTTAFNSDGLSTSQCWLSPELGSPFYRRLPPKIWGTSAWQLCRCETPGRLGSFIFVRVIFLRSRRTRACSHNTLWSRTSLSLKRYGRRNPLRGLAVSVISSLSRHDELLGADSLEVGATTQQQREGRLHWCLWRRTTGSRQGSG